MKVIFILFLLIKITFENCGFNSTFPKYRLEEPENIRNLQNVEFTPIRIYYDYTTLDSQTVSEDQKLNIKRILSVTKLIYERLLMVKRFNFPIKINKCDSRIKIDTNITNLGVSADLIIFPFVDILSNSTTQAYASGCVLATSNNRPVAGIIAFARDLKPENLNWMEYYITLATHELAHVLLFNPTIYNLFIDDDMKKIPIDKILKKVKINGLDRNLIITPKVLQVAKKHFNCSSLIGIELENQGGTGTALSHWEARIMLSDLMIGLSYDEAVFSEITLAFFEDSGWYKVNYFTGGLFRYGKNEGCDFTTTKCINGNNTEFPFEFCSTKPYAQKCTAGYLSRGICYITDHDKSLDPTYRYFSNPSMGGLSLSDYCPVSAVPTDSSKYYPLSCSSGISKYPSEMQEVVSRDSLCFISTLIKNEYYDSMIKKVGKNENAICYVHMCDTDKLLLQVIVGENVIDCPFEGGYKTLKGYQGNIYCPPFYRVCTGQVKCNNFIDCIIDKVLPNEISYSNINIVLPNKSEVTQNNTNISLNTLNTTLANNKTTNISNNIPTETNNENITQETDKSNFSNNKPTEQLKSPNNTIYFLSHFHIFINLLQLLITLIILY